jgi:hypothetical protein
LESELGRKIQVALSKEGARIFRNNVALAYAGNQVTWIGRDVIIKNARIIHCGLCPGSSDFIGWTDSGRFLAVEVKTPTGTSTIVQRDFINAVNVSGGIAFIARSEEEAISKLNSEDLY